jgi:transposase
LKRTLLLNSLQIQELLKLIKNNNHSLREGKKAQAILMLNAQTSREDIPMFTGYSVRNAQGLRKKYYLLGAVGLMDKPKKVNRLLTISQRLAVTEMLQFKKPSDFEYDTEIWSTSILGRIIKELFDVEYKSKTPLYLLFKEAKFTYHKPDKKYQRRNEQEVQEWCTKTTPIIEAAFNDPNVVILVEDEMVLSTQTTTQRVWLPVGEYPKIEVASKRKNRSIFGFLNLKTGMAHAYKQDWQNMTKTREVLEKVVALYPNNKILLIWDQAGWHRGSVVQEYISSLDGKISTLYFPAASPDLNPQEHVWKAGRSNVSHNVFIEDIDKATDEFIGFLERTNFPYSLLGFSA